MRKDTEKPLPNVTLTVSVAVGRSLGEKPGVGPRVLGGTLATRVVRLRAPAGEKGQSQFTCPLWGGAARRLDPETFDSPVIPKFSSKSLNR